MVDEQVGGLPVYKVRGMSTGNVRTLHRNHLFLVKYQKEAGDQQSNSDETSTEDTKDDKVSSQEKGYQINIDNPVSIDKNIDSDVTDESDSEFLEDDTRCGYACNSVEKNNSVLEAEEPEMTEVGSVEAEESPEDQSTETQPEQLLDQRSETQPEQLLDLIEIAHEETDVNEEEVAEEEVAEPEEIDPEVVELEEVGPHMTIGQQRM